MSGSPVEIKLVLVGNTNVGKTCLCKYAVTGCYDDSVSPTLGASYLSKTMSAHGREVKIQIWDTAGQEKYRGMTPMYYRGAQIALVVFSLVDYASFEAIDTWLTSLNEHGEPDVSFIVIGTKKDLESSRAISRKQGEDKALSIGAPYFETSAITGEGIAEILDEIPEIFFSKQNTAKDAPVTQVVELSSNKKDKKKGCC